MSDLGTYLALNYIILAIVVTIIKLTDFKRRQRLEKAVSHRRTHTHSEFLFAGEIYKIETLTRIIFKDKLCS